jgi:hypothetical protein
MNFQPKKPLQTLSDFVTQLEAETNNFTFDDAIEIVAYNNFLKQPLTKEMFIGEEQIFFDFNHSSKIIFLDKCKTIQDIAELSKKEGFEVYIKA